MLINYHCTQRPPLCQIYRGSICCIGLRSVIELAMTSHLGSHSTSFSVNVASRLCFFSLLLFLNFLSFFFSFFLNFFLFIYYFHPFAATRVDSVLLIGLSCHFLQTEEAHLFASSQTRKINILFYCLFLCVCVRDSCFYISFCKIFVLLF